jgi:hypothetical protein
MSLSNRSNHANGDESPIHRVRRKPLGYFSSLITYIVPAFIRNYFIDASNDYEMLERSPPTSPRNGVVNGIRGEYKEDKLERSDSETDTEASSPSSATSPLDSYQIEVKSDKTKRRRKRPNHTILLPDSLLTRHDSARNLRHSFHRGSNRMDLNHQESLKERNAQIALKQALDNVRPLQGSEMLIVLAAGIVALGACSTSKAFGDRFIEGVEQFSGSQFPSEIAKVIVEWTVAVANLATQFSLTTKSFIHVVSRVLRAMELPKHEFLRTLTAAEKVIMTLVTLTAFSSAKMVFDTTSDKEKYDIDLWICILLSGLSYTSSLAVNTNFTYDLLMNLRPERNDLAIIRLLKQTKWEVNKLAEDSDQPELFINRMANGTWFHQLGHVNAGLTPQEQLEDIIRQLIQLSDKPLRHDLFVANSRKAWINSYTVSSATLGGIGSAANGKAGLDVPQFVSLYYLPKARFTNLQDWSDYISLGLGSIFMLTSLGVNTIINGRSCLNLEKNLVFLWGEIRDVGLANYDTRLRIIFGSIFLLSLGYAIGKAGSTLKYALFEGQEAPTDVIALVTLFVCLGLGILSMQGAVSSALNRYDWGLMDEALAAADLTDFYKNLSPVNVDISDSLPLQDIALQPIGPNGFHQEDAEEKKSEDTEFAEEPTPAQWKLRRLLFENFNLAIDALIAHFNQIHPDVKDADLFSAETNKKLQLKFGLQAQQPQPAPQIHEMKLHPSPDSPSLPARVPGVSNSPIAFFLSSDRRVEANMAMAQSDYYTGFRQGGIRPPGLHTPRPITPRPLTHSSSASFSHAPLDSTNEQLHAEGGSPTTFRRPRGYGSFHSPD